MIGVVALLVVGPERLPRMARTVGLWVGKARTIVASVKQDIDRELRSAELKEILDEQAKLPELEEIMEQTSRTASEIKQVASGSGSPTPSATTAGGNAAAEAVTDAASQVSTQPAASSDDQK